MRAALIALRAPTSRWHWAVANVLLLHWADKPFDYFRASFVKVEHSSARFFQTLAVKQAICEDEAVEYGDDKVGDNFVAVALAANVAVAGIARSDLGLSLGCFMQDPGWRARSFLAEPAALRDQSESGGLMQNPGGLLGTFLRTALHFDLSLCTNHFDDTHSAWLLGLLSA